jgi:hypothetical protein
LLRRLRHGSRSSGTWGRSWSRFLLRFGAGG